MAIEERKNLPHQRVPIANTLNTVQEASSPLG